VTGLYIIVAINISKFEDEMSRHYSTNYKVNKYVHFDSKSEENRSFGKFKCHWVCDNIVYFKEIVVARTGLIWVG